jgi:hypothetical protein
MGGIGSGGNKSNINNKKNNTGASFEMKKF